MRSFISPMTMTMTIETFVAFALSFPFMDLKFDNNMTLSTFLLNAVYHRCIFLNPGLGIYLQASGRANGD